MRLTQPSPPVLPVALITGFLGSGKTSFLEHLARSTSPSPQPLLFLVNEFSSTDIDGPRLRRLVPEVTSLPGGSLFCRCLVTESIRVLHDLASRSQDAQPPFAGLIIEASGLANPKAIDTLLAETGLNRQLRLASIVTLVDPGSFPKLRSTLPTVIDQVEAADVLLVNKCDRYSPEAIAAVETDLRQLNATAQILHTTHGTANLNLFPSAPHPGDLLGNYSACQDPQFTVVQVTPPQPADLDRLRLTLHAYAADIHRAKGTVQTANGWFQLDLSASGLDLKPCPPPIPATADLVFLIRNPSAPQIAEALINPLRG